jgi:hypothetical protein
MSNGAVTWAGATRPRAGGRGRRRRRRSSSDDGLAALAVGLLDGLLDGSMASRGQHAADGEEAGLHDGVDAVPMPASRATL